MGGSGGSLGDKASGNVALGYHIGQGRRSWRAFSPPPPSVSFADLYQRAPPIPLYFSLAINTAVPFYVRDEFNFNNIVLPEPQFCVFLLRRTCLLPRCVWKYQLPLPVVIVVLGNGSLAFSIWFPPTVPCSSAPSNPDSSQPRHHRPSLLRCSTSFMPSTRLTDASDGNTSMWFPRGVVDEAHDARVDRVPDLPTYYCYQVEVVYLWNFAAVLICSAGIPTPLLSSSSSTISHTKLYQCDTTVLHPYLVRVLKENILEFLEL